MTVTQRLLRDVLLAVVGLVVGFVFVSAMLRDARQDGWNQGYQQGVHDERMIQEEKAGRQP